jgi:hypothetical protein
MLRHISQDQNRNTVKTMKRAFVSRCLACLAQITGLLIVCLMGVSPVLAADIELDVLRMEGESQQQLQARALQAAFTRAVYNEALDLLPGQLQPLRSELLYSFLSNRSAKYIQGYSDVSNEHISNGVRIYAHVVVNRNALKKMLQDLGILYTVDAFLPYTLSMGQGMGSIGEQITRLQFLSGLSSIHGVKPRLTLESGPQDVWSGHLESDSGEWRSRSKDLEVLWLTLWGNYFSRTGMAARGNKAMSVQVVGWKAPDDIRIFDEELQTWEHSVSAAELVDVSLEAGGLTARWQILTDKVQEVQQALDVRLAPQGLTVLLHSPDAALDVQPTAGFQLVAP